MVPIKNMISPVAEQTKFNHDSVIDNLLQNISCALQYKSISINKAVNKIKTFCTFVSLH